MRRLALISLLLAAGCPPKIQYPECKVDQDCADHGQVCSAGFCKECRDDGDCRAHPDRPLCTNALCVAKAECSAAQDCGEGRKCSPEGKCVAECAADADCGAGRKCIGGRCSAQESCNADADCGEGRACVNDICEAQGGVLESSASQRLGDCEVTAAYFGFDDATLTPEARRQLDADFQCLQRSDFRRALVSGHTDERGTTEYNLALGMRRAEAVKRYLTGLGLDPKRLKAVSFGKERPADPGHDEAAWSKNRRVELSTEQ
ncbi:MAG: OmpA family protein [Myxococcales bacterium]